MAFGVLCIPVLGVGEPTHGLPTFVSNSSADSMGPSLDHVSLEFGHWHLGSSDLASDCPRGPRRRATRSPVAVEWSVGPFLIAPSLIDSEPSTYLARAPKRTLPRS